jgi:hypothetical protein
MNKRLVVPADFVHTSPCPGIFAGYVVVEGLGNFLVEKQGEQYVALIPIALYEEAITAFKAVKPDFATILLDELEKGLGNI